MTGLVYVILISLWGVVLVPRWLRHHDESRRRREAERLERALNPHRAPAHHPADVDPDTAERYQSWGEYLRSLTRLDHSNMRWLESMRAPRSRHARRRRTISVGLFAVFCLGVVGAVAGVLPGFVAVLSALLLGAYVTAVFWQSRQWEARLLQRAASQHGEAAAWGAAPAPSAFARDLVTDGVRVVAGAPAEASTWEPKQTPLPTYTSKSKATKIPRRIDLTDRGWTGADMVEQARAQQHPELQQQFDREFAALEPLAEDEVGAYANPEEGYYRRAAGE